MGERYDRLKENAYNKLQDTWGQHAASTRAKYLDRWCRLCGVDDPKDIDYDNPYVHLEWFLCDPRYLIKLTSGKRNEVLAEMDEIQQ
ncbi:MAG: hypothetical protein IKN41_08185 [Candidatus Methanomethylophilaceae archaeon]|nr:hypothetical protein [Candidatus Methanomethylophilaceae archaeon]